MTLRGTIRNGKVELDSETTLPEGTRVDVEPSAAESLLDLVLRHSVSDPTIPKDFASELDHYMYGLPKRTGKGKANMAKRAKPAAAGSKRPRRGTGR